MKITLTSGMMRETADIPDENFSGTLQPLVPSPPIGKESDLFARSLSEPIESPGLEEFISTRSKVSIIVDDLTRPTPTKTILPFLLKTLLHFGIKEEHIKITVGNGLHDLHTKQELESIVGDSVFKRFDVSNNDAHAKMGFAYLGTTRNGTPLYVNKRVTESDLVVTVGTIKPHSFAGFTGGAKSILPGVSGGDTILRNHCYDCIDYPKGIVGEPDMSYARADMEDAITKIPVPVFIVNVVIDKERRILGTFAGDPVIAHRKGVEFFRAISEVTVDEQADVVFIEGNYPASESLYFTLSMLAGVMTTRKPIVKKGGMVVVVAQCKNGVDSDIIDMLFSTFSSPKVILEHLKESPVVEGQWAAQHLAWYLNEYEIGIVSQGISMDKAKQLNMRYFKNLQGAVNYALAHYGRDKRILVVKHTDNFIANARENNFNNIV